MAACSDATGTDATGTDTSTEPADLAGTWTATSFVLTSVANPATSVDLVAEDGAAMTLVLGADGTYTFSFVSNEEAPENEAGTYTVSGTTLTVTPTDGPQETMAIVRAGDTMTLTLDDRVQFTDGGAEEDAVLVITLTRTDPPDETDPTGVEPADLAGTWTATAIVFTSVANPTLSVDEVADGAAMTLVLSADGEYTLTFVFPGEPNENETGTYTVSGSTLTITPPGGSQETIGVSRNGDTMTLTLDDIYDFDDQGEEDATLVITLTR
jgi:hypothetical protein